MSEAPWHNVTSLKRTIVPRYTAALQGLAANVPLNCVWFLSESLSRQHLMGQQVRSILVCGAEVQRSHFTTFPRLWLLVHVGKGQHARIRHCNLLHPGLEFWDMTLSLGFICLRIALVALKIIARVYKLIISFNFFAKKSLSSAAALPKVYNMENASDQFAYFAFREKSGHSFGANQWLLKFWSLKSQ